VENGLIHHQMLPHRLNMGRNGRAIAGNRRVSGELYPVEVEMEDAFVNGGYEVVHAVYMTLCLTAVAALVWILECLFILL